MYFLCHVGAEWGGVRYLLFFNDKCAVGAAEPERIAQHRIYLCVDAMCCQSQFGRVFVGVFKVDVGRNKAALHHQYGVNHLACARHPALVPCHSFGRTNPGHVLAKQSVERDGLEHVAL